MGQCKLPAGEASWKSGGAGFPFIRRVQKSLIFRTPGEIAPGMAGVMEMRGTISTTGRDCGESCGNALRSGNRCSNDRCVGAHVQGAPEIHRGLDAPLQDHGNRSLRHQCGQQVPGGAEEPGARRGITGESSRDRIGACVDGPHRLGLGGDVGEDRQSEFIVNPPYDLRPRLTKGRLSVSAVDGEDRGPGRGDGLGGERNRR